MKQIILLLCTVMMFVIGAKAQTASTLPLVAGDTVVNTGTASKTLQLTGGYAGVVIQPVLAKISGTVAGNVVLYQSLDGTNYISTGDTIKNTNVATNTAVWIKAAPVPVYYMIQATGSGTMSAQLQIKYVARKYQNQ